MLNLHRSERADQLVAALGDLLLDALEDPMAGEVVAVPTRGVERWLTQRLAHRLGAARGDADGVCANVHFPFPGTLVALAVAGACGFEPETDPWSPARSVWPLLGLVDALIAEPFLAPLAAHLEAASPPGSDGSKVLRRFGAVRHLADLYDRYSVHRPGMIQAWADGPGAVPGGAGRPTAGGAGEASWQAELWRRLRERIGEPSPGERLERVAGEIAARPELLDLPRRLSLFGLTSLPPSHLRLLEAIAVHRDVHLFLLHPSNALWEKVESAVAGGRGPLRRSEDETAPLVANPLLRSWGRDAREMQLVLLARGIAGGEHRPVPSEQGGDRSPTLLERIQADVRADRLPPGAPEPNAEGDKRPLLAGDDDSLRVYSCHGRLRQVEVVRDAILHLLAADATLEARDVIVMCPDIESFAPLVDAAFSTRRASGEPGYGAGATEAEPGPPELRVRLADRSLRQTNPILATAAHLLELAAGRVTASEVLDLAAREPVKRRFRFDDEDLSQIERWVAGTGIRWGLDGDHRAPWKLSHVEANTWKVGLDRLLLGAAMSEEGDRLFAGVLPLDDVSSGAVDLAGRFAELVERLEAAVDSLQGRLSVGQWRAALAGATESLAVAPPQEGWQHDQLQRVLDEVCADPGDSGPLDLAELRSLLDDRLRGRPTRANFRTGDLTVCTLVPMRSVPHRVVCLLGLDDGAFPRHLDQDGDDLLLADPQVGDRDARSEDRQLLLDALMAATEHLVIAYEGRDPRTNQERSPCVPVAELLDVVDRTVRVCDDEPRGRRASDCVRVEQPLQSFDQRNFVPGELVPGDAWSFDPVDLEGARALATPPSPRRPFLSSPLPPRESPVLQLDALVDFLEHPVRAFLRERLGWYGTGGPDEVKDALPVELDGLERWGVGERMLVARLAGAPAERARRAEEGRGLLPPGALAAAELVDVELSVGALVDHVLELGYDTARAPRSVEVNVTLPDGRALAGTVPGIHPGPGESGEGERLVRCLYSRLGPRHRLGAWARFLALTAARPARAVTAVTIGRSQGRSKGRPTVAISELGPLAPQPEERRGLALSHLALLVDLYDRGLSEPLPLYTATSEAFARAVRDREDAMGACRRVWESSAQAYGEDGEPEHLLVHGGRARLDDLMRERPREGESGPGWPGHASRLGRLSCRLWDPLLEHESLRYSS